MKPWDIEKKPGVLKTSCKIFLKADSGVIWQKEEMNICSTPIAREKLKLWSCTMYNV